MSNTLYDALFAPHLGSAQPYLVKPDGGVLTYGDFLKMAARYAHAVAAAGVGPGDRIAVQIAKSPEALALYVASVQAGAIFLPLNTAYMPAEVEYFVGNAEPKLVVCDPSGREALAPITENAGAVLETLAADGSGTLSARAEGQPEAFDTVARGPDDLAAFLYTSGTTGRSKGAMLTHDNLLSNAETLREVWRFTADDRLLHALPIFHTHGLFVAVNTVTAAGGSMIWLPGFKLDEVISHMPDATSMMGVPTFYTRLLDDARFTRELVAHMRLFTSGSAPLLAETHVAFEERTGHRILERYGMTETNMNTSNPYDGERRPGTVGMALPGVSLRIANPETGEVLKQGDVGVIEVKGPNVFKGYWRNPEKTAEEFRSDGFFITGDLAFIDDEGYVHIVGRAKDLVISGGFNVYPAEVEAEIDALPGVAESAVIGLPHADFGEGVTAIVAPRPGVNLSEDAIRSALEDALAKYKVPKRVFVVDSLPRNTMGKIQKNVLRETYKDTYSEDAA